MYATEFKTIIKGSSIQIPDYENFKNKQVRVIIIETEQDKAYVQKEDFISQLMKSPRHISTDVEFLTRIEANER